MGSIIAYLDYLITRAVLDFITAILMPISLEAISLFVESATANRWHHASLIALKTLTAS